MKKNVLVWVIVIIHIIPQQMLELAMGIFVIEGLAKQEQPIIIKRTIRHIVIVTNKRRQIMAKNFFRLGILLMITVFGLISTGCGKPCTVNCKYFLNTEESCYRTKCSVEKAKDSNKYGVTCDCN